MAVIELDLSADPEPGPPAWRASRVAAVILLCGLLFAGAPEVVPKPWAQEVAQIRVPPGSGLTVSGADVIISAAREVVAYALATGQERWRVNTGLSGGDVWPHNGLLIVTGPDPAGLEAREFRPRTIAIDQATGHILWRLNGGVYPQADLMVQYRETMISLLRDDGTTVWTVDGHGVNPVIDEQATIVATLDKATGELVERLLPNLIELRRAILPAAQGADGMWFYDGTLNIFRGETEPIRYDAATLTQLAPAPENDFRLDCGRLWCMLGAKRLVDKATGAIVHLTRDWEYAISNDAGVLGLAVLVGDGEPTPVLEIFDPRTAAVTDLTGWVALNLNPGAPIHSPGGTVLLALRAQNSSYLAVFDDRGLHHLGVLPTRDLSHCALTTSMIACRAGADLVRLWRLTPSLD